MIRNLPLGTWLAIVAAALLLAMVVLLASGAFAPKAKATDALTGDATWYCNDDPRWPASRCPVGFTPEHSFAAVPQGLGIDEGDTIVVSRGNASVTVPVVDTCADPCSVIVDLSLIAFAEIADPGRGRVAVTVEVGAGATLPPTDVADQSVCDPPPHPDDERMRDEVR